MMPLKLSNYILKPYFKNLKILGNCTNNNLPIEIGVEVYALIFIGRNYDPI
jgi:hypothetical protein